MAETWRYRGQEIGSQQITLLREFIRAIPPAAAGSYPASYAKPWAGSRPTAPCATWYAAVCC